VTITATQLKQQTHLLDQAIREDIQVTKHNRPFVVVVNARRYQELVENAKGQATDFDKALDAVDGVLTGKNLPDPVEWQKAFREENDRDPWNEVLSDVSH
jgi:prevent-host-death family protein